MIKTRFHQLFFPHDHHPGHFKALDGLRGFAVLLVLLSHTSIAQLYLFDVLDFSKAGRTGVYLFFILSAYLLDGQIANKLQKKQANNLYWKNYFLRRFTRIYPLFALSLIAYFMVDRLGYSTAINESSDIPMHLLLQRGKSIFWSIPVEFVYYFISPILIYISYKWLNWQLKFVIPLFILFMAAVFIGNERGVFSEISTFKFLIIFLFGALLAIFELVRPTWFSSGKKGIFELAGFLAFFVLIFSTPAFLDVITDRQIVFFRPRYHIVFGLAGVSLIVACKYGMGWIKRIFELKLLRFFGAISFSMYLIHTLVLRAIILFFKLDGQLALLLFFVITISVSVLSYTFIEKPLMKFRIGSPSTGSNSSKSN